jgi:hypothetical protein
MDALDHSEIPVTGGQDMPHFIDKRAVLVFYLEVSRDDECCF